jgi:hypothetical protein
MAQWRCWFVASVCAYELSALAPGSPVPTITSMVHRGRQHPHPLPRAAAFALSCAGLAWAAHHLLMETPVPAVPSTAPGSTRRPPRSLPTPKPKRPNGYWS